MPLQIEVPDLYPVTFVIITYYSLFMTYCGVQVMKARKTYGVKLPAAYENKEDSVFNRYQRVHANCVEGVSNFQASLLISALTTPTASIVAGVVFCIGRMLYAQGYYKSTSARQQGAVGSLAQLYLLGGSIYTGYKLLVA